MNAPFSPPLEIWGGIESTINRIGDVYRDQLVLNGHLYRLTDLDQIAELGIRTLRYPIQWERVAPEGLEHANWSWADERLKHLHSLGITPIIGLTHHGSGPRSTSLIDPSFAEGLASYASLVAQRYPWVTTYTPVNEPLTTARFSALYGHWYPHAHDERTFLRALLIQCWAVVLTMQAIRQIIPTARLVQTEDIGKTFSTPLLAYQAEFENERRWLTFDLLCGHLNSNHRLWEYLLHLGIDRSELEWFLDHPCPPDVLGINYYLTSERFLDEHKENYPNLFHGRNGEHTYADVEAVRVSTDYPLGHYARLKEVWERYHIPVAITEVHLNCTREEQLRWFLQSWQAAKALRNEGADIRAVTAWSLLGAFDWNSLLTRNNGFYETGVFDIRAPRPRPTALASVVRSLTQGHEPEHPVLGLPGWWQRPIRLHHQPNQTAVSSSSWPLGSGTGNKRAPSPILILGGFGPLEQTFAYLCDIRGLPYRLLADGEINRADNTSVNKVLKELNPWAVIHTAGAIRVNEAEYETQRSAHEQTLEMPILADACAQHRTAFLTFSSDLVFDGLGLMPYVESDPVTPQCVYGNYQAQAEKAVLHQDPTALIIRTSALFGPWDTDSVVSPALREHLMHHWISSADETVISPTYIPDLVHACLDLLIDGERGIWHLTNTGSVTWAQFAQQVAKHAGICAKERENDPCQTGKSTASRPSYRALGSERGVLLSSWNDALSRALQNHQYRQLYWQRLL